MNRELITRLFESPSENTVEALFEDEETVFWVDWRDARADPAAARVVEPRVAEPACDISMTSYTRLSPPSLYASRILGLVRRPLPLGHYLLMRHAEKENK